MSSSRPTPRHLPALVLGAALTLGGHALAGGTAYTTVQPGPWADPATWDIGSVPMSVGDGSNAVLAHDVIVDALGAASSGLLIGEFGSLGPVELRVVDGGALQTETTLVGAHVDGILRHEGGSSDHFQLRLGSNFGGDGDFILSGGSVTADSMSLGGFPGSPAQPGLLRIDGSAGTFAINQELFVRSNSTIEVRPTADGGGGLTTIQAGTATFQAGADLVVAPDYPAQVGDSWDIVETTGLFQGMPNLLVASPYGMVLEMPAPGRLRVTVTSSPYPLAGDTCATALPLAIGAATFVNQPLATASDPGPTCASDVTAADIWFAVENPGPGPAFLSVQLDDAPDTMSLEVYAGCGGALLDCIPSAEVILPWVQPAGTTYYLRAASAISQPLPFLISVTENEGEWTILDGGSPGVAGVPQLEATGPLVAGGTIEVTLSDAAPNALALLWLSLTSSPQSIFGGTLYAFPFTDQVLVGTDAAGVYSAATVWPDGVTPGTVFWMQFLCEDGTVPAGITLSNAVRGETPSSL